MKATTTKTISQKGGFLNFLRPLLTAGLPLTKSVPTTLAKKVLLLLWVTASASATDAVVSKENLWMRRNRINIFK